MEIVLLALIAWLFFSYACYVCFERASFSGFLCCLMGFIKDGIPLFGMQNFFVQFDNFFSSFVLVILFAPFAFVFLARDLLFVDKLVVFGIASVWFWGVLYLRLFSKIGKYVASVGGVLSLLLFWYLKKSVSLVVSDHYGVDAASFFYGTFFGCFLKLLALFSWINFSAYILCIFVISFCFYLFAPKDLQRKVAVKLFLISLVLYFPLVLLGGFSSDVVLNKTIIKSSYELDGVSNFHNCSVAGYVDYDVYEYRVVYISGLPERGLFIKRQKNKSDSLPTPVGIVECNVVLK